MVNKVGILELFVLGLFLISFASADMAGDMEAALVASGGDPSAMIQGMVEDQLAAAEKNEPCEAQQAKVDELMNDLENARGDEYKYECIRSCIGFTKGLVTKEAIFSWITMNSIQHEMGGEYCTDYGYSIDSCNICGYEVEMPTEEDMVMAGMTGPMIAFAQNMPAMAEQAFNKVEEGWKKQIEDSKKDTWDDYEDKAFEGLTLKEKFSRAFGSDYDDNTMTSKVLSLFSDSSPESMDRSRQLAADTVNIVGKLSGFGYFVLQPFGDVISPTTSAKEKVLAGVDLAFMFAPAVSQITKSIKGLGLIDDAIDVSKITKIKKLGFVDDAIDISKLSGVEVYKTHTPVPGIPNKYLKIEKGAMESYLFRKKALNPGHFDDLVGFGDDYLQMHFDLTHKSQLGKALTKTNFIDTLDLVEELGLKYPIVIDTPNTGIINEFVKRGAVITESPTYQRVITRIEYERLVKIGRAPSAPGPVQRIIFSK